MLQVIYCTVFIPRKLTVALSFVVYFQLLYVGVGNNGSWAANFFLELVSAILAAHLLMFYPPIGSD